MRSHSSSYSLDRPQNCRMYFTGAVSHPISVQPPHPQTIVPYIFTHNTIYNKPFESITASYVIIQERKLQTYFTSFLLILRPGLPHGPIGHTQGPRGHRSPKTRCSRVDPWGSLGAIAPNIARNIENGGVNSKTERTCKRVELDMRCLRRGE